MTQSPDPDPIKKDERHRLKKFRIIQNIENPKMSENIRKTNNQKSTKNREKSGNFVDLKIF